MGQMEVKRALIGQYRAALAMLRQTIADVPEVTWLAGRHPRNFWRIAYHALFYTHLYAMPTEHDFVAWTKHSDCTDLWDEPEVKEPYTQSEVLEYLDFIDAHIGDWVQALDLDSQESGFSWYPDLQKLDHQMVNLRHLAGHAGQLAELAMNGGVDEVAWSTRVPRRYSD